ncbi:hypothetical protein [Hafnia alvei]|uniref:hypothetical protein n=1 Tax=Hafnia alvei TaxID=569 RepID=UPI0012D37414|nr:hypothetical protein [Hafnia alvei]
MLKEYRYELERRSSDHRPKSKTPGAWELMDRYCLRKGGYVVYHGFTASGYVIPPKR